jgi:hypothetical protein
MTKFNLEPQKLVINRAADFPMLWYIKTAPGFNLIETNDVFTAGTKTLVSEGAGYSPDADGVMADPDGVGAGTAIAIADVDALNIVGHKWYRRGEVTRVTKSRGIGGQKQISTLAFALASPDAGAQIVLKITFSSWDEKGEYATHNSDFKVDKEFVIDLATGETPTTLATKVAAMFSEQGQKEQRYFPLTVTASGATITFTAKDEYTAFTMSVYGVTDTIFGGTTVNQVSSGKVTPTVTVTQLNFSGRNNYANLRMEFPETNQKVYPFAKGPEAKQLISSSDVYSCFIIEESVPPSYEDVHGLGYQGNRYVKSFIYLNETTCKDQINYLVAYFNSVATTKVDMPATTPAAALAVEALGTTLTVNP